MNLYQKPRRGVPGALECVCCFETCCFGCEVARRLHDPDGTPEEEEKEEKPNECHRSPVRDRPAPL